MLVMMEQVYPYLMNVWDEQFEMNNGDIRDSDFIREVEMQMKSDWRPQYDKIARQFLRICQVQGDYPVYHQLLPEEEQMRTEKRIKVKQVAEKQVLESRRQRDDKVRKMKISYTLPNIEKLRVIQSKQDNRETERETARMENERSNIKKCQMAVQWLRKKQDTRARLIARQREEKRQRDLKELRARMKAIKEARDFKILAAATAKEAIERCRKDADLIKKKTELETALKKVSDDLEDLQETLSERAALFASRQVREKAYAREATLMGKEKRLKNELADVMWSMDDNESWFTEKKEKFESHIETSHDKFQYQRVIAGLTGFGDEFGEDDDQGSLSDEDDIFL